MTVARHLLLRTRRVGSSGPVIPPGSIAMWSGTLDTIPANWNLCDGSGGTPNLVARFLRGAPAATEPGTTGGADSHSHASMTSAGDHAHLVSAYYHVHSVNFAGDHFHGEESGTEPGMGVQIQHSARGIHGHITNASATHVHTVDKLGAHTHTINAADGRPPYYEIAFIQAGAGAKVAVGLIIIWAGLLADIPAGWALCDSGDGRPDLRTKFLRGVNTNVTNPGGVGGNATHLHTEVNAIAHSHTEVAAGTHFHTFAAYSWSHSHPADRRSGTGASASQPRTASPSHTHANSDSIGSHDHNPLGNSATHHLAHVVNAASSLPVYYDVAYIINTAAVTIPSNGVLVWTGLLPNVPAGYNICDGGGGRPDLRVKFLRGSADGVNPGGEGGNDTHTHADQVGGSHNDHSQAPSGEHQHALTDMIGYHQHYPSPVQVLMGGFFKGQDAPGGSHNHTYDLGGNHTHTLTSDGEHYHNPWSTDDGRPAYYEVAFIMRA